MLRDLPCGVVESDRFMSMVESHFPNLRDWDEIKNTVDYDIARFPEAFELIPGTPSWRGVTLLTDPPLTLCFRYDGDAGLVHLVALF